MTIPYIYPCLYIFQSILTPIILSCWEGLGLGWSKRGASGAELKEALTLRVHFAQLTLVWVLFPRVDINSALDIRKINYTESKRKCHK